MHTRHLIKNLSTALVLCSLFCCKKSGGSDTHDNPSLSVRAQLLCQRPWIEIAGKESFNNIGWTDVFCCIPECDKDNQFVWSTDGTYSFTTGTIKCDTSDPAVFQQGTWELTGVDDGIIRTHSSLNQSSDYLIQKLDNDTLHVTSSYESNGRTIFTDITLVHP